MEQHLGGQQGEAKAFWKAFSFAVDAHKDQIRKSGEPFISHPCRVALILVEEMGVLDPEALAAAILHDTVEDVPEVTSEVIGELFGKDIESIVDGCTKISNFSGDQHTFYNIVHRKIFSGAASQVSVMLIKLADRLHNLRTMDSMPKRKRQKIAEETLSVYAPMAKVMGLFSMKRELYNLALTYKFPRQSHKIITQIRHIQSSYEVMEIQEKLQKNMQEAWITCEIMSRARGISAYYDPHADMLNKTIDNPVQVIIVVPDIQSCYRALGVINQIYPPIPRSIRDFIANPKPTGYQSLHAKANIRGKNYLFKIRTQDMLSSARTGLIKEWLTQGKMPGGFEREIREMFDILGTDDVRYRDVLAASGKKEIYTYTPKGERICLPRQSIVLDFAFKVHTEVGSKCSKARVGQKEVGLDYVLKDGDRVQITVSDHPVRFSPRIQALCQSPRARSEIARMFRLRRANVARQVGESLLMQELKRYGIPLTVLEDEKLADILVYFDLENLDDLYRETGYGNLRIKELIYEIKNGLYAGQKTLMPPSGILNRFELTTLDPICIKLSRCCNPIPSETGLLGLLSERGISIHRKVCIRLQSLKVQREDVIEMRWNLKKTHVEQIQTLLILGASRHRVLMMLGTAPVEMKLHEIIDLSGSSAKSSDWEVRFHVETLNGLKYILSHFTKSGLTYEFYLDT